VLPPTSYEYRHPEGTGKDTPPFYSAWFLGGFTPGGNGTVGRDGSVGSSDSDSNTSGDKCKSKSNGAGTVTSSTVSSSSSGSGGKDLGPDNRTDLTDTYVFLLRT
jgi:hypothetical protein